MSGLLDANILICAVNQDHSSCQRARSFLEGILNRPDPVYLCWSVFYEFLRVTTHPKVFARPLTWAEASQFLENLFRAPNLTLLLEGENHFRVLQDLLKPIRNPSGNFLHDCHIAAILKENGVTKIYTHDTDFRNFPFLEIEDPLSGT